MSLPAADSFPRYLAAKKTIDDRALNGQVWQALAGQWPAGPARVLEVGAGIGTMLERLLERGLLQQAHYLAVDEQAENLAAARERLPAWAAAHGWRADPRPGGWEVRNGPAAVEVEYHAGDLLALSAQPEQQGAWDVLIAHAVLDLLDLETALPQLLAVLRPGGLFYFSLNFDGATLFQPEIEPEFDARLEAAYHRTMDERLTGGRPSGDSHTGRHLFGHLRRAGAEVLAAGSSDWVVFPVDGRYPADEAYFLHFIIRTVGEALRGRPGLEPGRLQAWVAERHAQIERAELTYIAHQLDFLGRRPLSAGRGRSTPIPPAGSRSADGPRP